MAKLAVKKVSKPVHVEPAEEDIVAKMVTISHGPRVVVSAELSDREAIDRYFELCGITGTVHKPKVCGFSQADIDAHFIDDNGVIHDLPKSAQPKKANGRYPGESEE